MSRRVLLSGFFVVVCFVAFWGLVAQHEQLASLRSEHRLLLAQLASSPPAPSEPSSRTLPSAVEVSTVPAELLRLRGEVTRLSERKRELARVEAENKRVRAQAANSGSPSAAELPPGYRARSQARMVGYGTPSNTLQTLLWAIHNRDLTHLLQAFTPAGAQQIQNQLQQSGGSADEFFRAPGVFAGMRVLSQQQISEGAVELAVELIPGLTSEHIRFQQIDNEWKMQPQF